MISIQDVLFKLGIDTLLDIRDVLAATAVSEATKYQQEYSMLEQYYTDVHYYTNSAASMPVQLV